MRFLSNVLRFFIRAKPVGNARLVSVRVLSVSKDAKTGLKPVENERLVTKIHTSLLEDSVILLPGLASGKCKSAVSERCVSSRTCCDAATYWKPGGNARFVSKGYYVSC
jgi:hypothetical protein